MNLKNLTIEISAVLACYLMMSLPIAGATTVNIRLNGQLMDSVEYEPSDIVNLNVGYVRDPNDISWTNVRVAITLNSASMAHTISKVYLYKCGTLSPTSCLQKTPEVFDAYVDTEIAWSDISDNTGQQTYPQEGSILFLVKLDNPDGVSSWSGMWSSIRRPSYREFIFREQELGDMDVHASASQFVAPIAAYIENFNAIPFSWLTRAAFDSADSITAIGGDDSDLDSSPPSLQSVQPSGKDITVINKENYFIFPTISGGFGNPITLEQNPGFECGDGRCKSTLGESSEICCYDCGCESGFCDSVPGSPETGVCRSPDNIGLDVVGIPSAEVTDCSRSFEVAITARVNNPPDSMSQEVTGSVNIAGETYPAECSKSSGLYTCRFTMLPTVRCGSGTTQIGPNELTLTLTYNDGANQVSKDISETFSAINVNYDCGCQGDSYCDSGTDTCESEDAITLGITELTSYLDNYNPGDTIRLKAKIFNPPTGTVLVSASANLSLTNGVVSPGTPSCTGPSEEFEYECTIPFSITGYQDSVNYKFYPNYLDFQITYNDGDSAKTKNLVTGFGPLSIPSQNCGNGVANQDETYANCCQDVGCEFPNEYCDVSRGCSSLDDITLSVIPYPLEFEDCHLPHEVSLRTTIENAPYGVRMDYKSITINDQPVPWQFECPSSSIGGIFDCLLEIPPLQGCELPSYEVGPNKMSMSISFPEGTEEGVSRSLDINASFSNLYVKPVPHIDGTCEPGLGENGATACVDCPCADDVNYGEDYYCDFDRYNNPGGTCRLKSDMELVVETPTSPVRFNTCEKHNSYAILMHVRNQPASMEVENVFATVGGEAARYVNCRESQGRYLESNMTLNCSITLPSISTCSQGETYNYSDNSISLVITFDDGERGAVLKTLTAETPDIFITQEIRSLHDIIDDAELEMNAVLEKMIQLTEDTADVLYDCIELQMIVAALSVAITFALGIMGAKAGGTPEPKLNEETGKVETEKSWSLWGFKQGVDAGQKMGESLTTVFQKYCEALEAINRIEIKLEEMQLELIERETCLAVNQHMLDSGKCKGQEQSCFDSMISCLNFNDLDNIRDRISNDFKGMSQNLAEMTQAVGGVAEGFGMYKGIGTYEDANLYVSLGAGNIGIISGDTVCPLSDATSYTYYPGFHDRYQLYNPCYTSSHTGMIHPQHSNLRYTTLEVVKTHPVGCQYSFVGLEPPNAPMQLLLNRQPSSSDERYNLNLAQGYPVGEYTLYMFCSDDVNVNTDIYRPEHAIRDFRFNIVEFDTESHKCYYGDDEFLGVLSQQSAITGSGYQYRTVGYFQSVCNAQSSKEVGPPHHAVSLYESPPTTVSSAARYNSICDLNQDTRVRILQNDIGCKGHTYYTTYEYPYYEMWKVELIDPSDELRKECKGITTGWVEGCRVYANNIIPYW